MIGTRYEEYGYFEDGLPFKFAAGIERTSEIYSKDKNWHEDLEIQLCTGGRGEVILNGKKYNFSRGNTVIVDSNTIHYTGAIESVKYDCLIISAQYCRRMGIECESKKFTPLIRDDKIEALITEIKSVVEGEQDLKIARLHEILLRLLIYISENYSVKKNVAASDKKSFENIKTVIRFIRENYHRKLSLDEIASEVLMDKYTLCREFKKVTGQTVVENINKYRCIKASELLAEGNTVAKAAELCGFENLSFFTKTFKKYIGSLPSKFKK